MIVYLAGPIFQCSDSEAQDWRETLKQARPDITFLDPMMRDYRGKEDESVNLIVEGDKEDIRASDIVVANISKLSAGTLMEVLYAWEQGKVVVAIISGRISPWIRYHSHVIAASVEEAVQGLGR